MPRTITFTYEQLEVIDTLMNHGFECFLDDRISEDELLDGWNLTQEKIEDAFTLINGEYESTGVELENVTDEWYDADGNIKH